MSFSGESNFRRGPFKVGDRVQLTDPKGRLHTIVLEPDKQFHTHRGAIEHNDLIGSSEGIVVSSSAGVPYLAVRPLYEDFVLSMPRGATIVYPKDAAAIVGLADIYPGARVIEAGAGSGALSIALLRAVGDQGTLTSFERRADFAEVATRNVQNFFGSPHPSWTLINADLNSGLAQHHVKADRVVLDMLAPWDCIDAVAKALEPGGVLVAYVATTTQLSRLAEDLRKDGRWMEPAAQESLVREWHLEGLAVRPEHRMIAHTGFLLKVRRLADGVVAPPRRTRPAKGAYGEDYEATNS